MKRTRERPLSSWLVIACCCDATGNARLPNYGDWNGCRLWRGIFRVDSCANRIDVGTIVGRLRVENHA